jgi:hypothetical protein
MTQKDWASRCKVSDLYYFFLSREFEDEDYFKLLDNGVDIHLIVEAAMNNLA